MFDERIALERKQGTRGPFTRFFGRVSSPSEASLVLRESAIALLGVAALWALLAIRGNSFILLFAAAVACPAALLFLRPLRAATGCLFLQGLLLLGVAGVSLAQGALINLLPVGLGAATLLLAIRARQAIRLLNPTYIEAFMAPEPAPEAPPEIPEPVSRPSDNHDGA